MPFPLVIHFTIVLLLVAPLFIVANFFLSKGEGRLVFSVLSGVLAVMVLAPKFLRREPSRILNRMFSLVFLMSHVAGTMVLISTAHGGGRLVHELGIHASAPVSPQAAHAAAPNDVDRD